MHVQREANQLVEVRGSPARMLRLICDGRSLRKQALLDEPQDLVHPLVRRRVSIGITTGNTAAMVLSSQGLLNRVQELMLAANMAVAALLADAFPDAALLRRHPPPLEKKMAELGALSDKLGLELDVSGAGPLQASLQVRGFKV